MIKRIQKHYIFCAVALMTSGNVLAQDSEQSWLVESRHISIVVNEDGTYEETKEATTILKTQSAVDALGEEQLLYSSDSEEMVVLEAYTVLPSGEHIHVKEDQIRTVESDIDGGAAEFSDDRYKVIIYPALVPGSGTYYKVKKQVHTALYPGHFTFASFYNSAIEYGDVTITITYPKNLDLRFSSREFYEEINELEHTKQNKYTLKKQSIVPKERGQVWYGDYAPAVFVSTFKNYGEFGKAYEKRAGPQVIINDEIRDLTLSLTSGFKSRRDKAKAIYNWVAQNIRYVALNMGAGGVVPHPASEILKNRYGDCKDKSTLLITMLKVIEIDGLHALISSGDAYKLPPIPVHSPINHVITYLPEFDLYVDATRELAPFGVLSSGNKGKPVLHSATGDLSVTPVLEAEEHGYRSELDMILNPDGTISGSSNTEYFGLYEVDRRYQLDFFDDKDKRDYVKSYFDNFLETGDGTLHSTDVRDLNTPLVTRSQFDLDPLSNVPGPGALRIPVGLTPGDIEYFTYSSPEKSATRPMRCSAYSYRQVSTLQMPKNVTLLFIPESVFLQVGSYSYQAKYSQSSSGLISVDRHLMVKRDRVVCSPDEHDDYVTIINAVKKDVRSQIIYR
jgi:hypothetical protein